jgi:Concanavalin A-like lectin/glucanases superfamily
MSPRRSPDRPPRGLSRFRLVGLVALSGVCLLTGAGALGVGATGATLTAVTTSSGSLTTRTACTAGTGYPAAVQALHPTLYWRFGDPSGSTAVADDSGNGNDGLVVDSSPGLGALPVTLGTPGSGLIWCDGTNGLLSASSPVALGSGSFVVWPAERPNLDTFSIAAWIRTTSVTGGRVIGMGSSTWADDVNTDRQIFLNDAGHAVFGVAPAGVRHTLISPAAVNDGQPHFLVATLGPAGAQLFVDGVLVAADATVTTAEQYTGNEQQDPPPPAGGSGGPTPDGFGYWRVGWDNLSGWGPTDGGLAGVIDEAAVFENTQLTAAQVAALWAANHW